MKIKFNSKDNAAFCDGNREWETARILRRIADEVENGRTEGVIHDVNGNRVGEWKA
jgi:hypothetical protein